MGWCAVCVCCAFGARRMRGWWKQDDQFGGSGGSVLGGNESEYAHCKRWRCYSMLWKWVVVIVVMMVLDVSGARESERERNWECELCHACQSRSRHHFFFFFFGSFSLVRELAHTTLMNVFRIFLRRCLRNPTKNASKHIVTQYIHDDTTTNLYLFRCGSECTERAEKNWEKRKRIPKIPRIKRNIFHSVSNLHFSSFPTYLPTTTHTTGVRAMAMQNSVSLILCSIV